tara:strand:+ start:172 stop:4323 length:4152 start_codon:yes stop_codon:yes gene_type:complete
MNYNAYIAFNLNETEFEGLANSLAERLTGNESIFFAKGKDGGKDGRRLGFKKNLKTWKSGRFIYQAKHTQNSNASCSENKFYGNKSSIINLEIDGIKRLIKNQELDYYLLITNRKYTGSKDYEIRNAISEATSLDIDNIEIFGIETLNHLLNLESNRDLVLQYNLCPNPSELNFSDLKPLVLEARDKSILLDNIELDNINYIKRSFVKSSDDNSFYNYNESIENIIEKENFICLLGNPGTGKTITLKKLALDLWKDGKQTTYTPIYKNLKNFTTNNTIENYLPEQHKLLNEIIFIFDGIDEIAEIQNFESALQNFIKAKISKSEKNFKIIVSCRNNIYNKEVINILQFKTYYIQDLSFDQSIYLLKKLCSYNLIDSFKFNNRLKEYLKTPLQTEILATYINKHKKLTENIGLLWEAYINQRFKIDSSKKLIKRRINTILIKKESQKIGIINELRKTRNISEETLSNIFDYSILKEFIKNPLLDKDITNNTFSFQNRNIQEYFAAKSLSKLSFKRIIKIISVKGTKITHPNLLNTISFLIDLAHNQESEKLINWFYVNQVDVLLNSDSNRIGKDNRITIFQNYFKEKCIEKALWIGNYSEATEIAKFGDCEENYSFLMEIIQNNKYHFRVIQSALSLLANFSISGNKQKTTEIFINLLTDKEVLISIKEEILDTIYHLKLTKFQTDLLASIFDIFKDNDKESISFRKLQLLKLEENIDNYYSFYLDEFLKDNKFKIRDIPSKVRQGGFDYLLNELIFKFSNGYYFLSIVKYYFTKSHHIYSKLDEPLIRKVIDTINTDEKLIITFYELIKEKYRFYNKDKRDLLTRITKQTNTQKKLCLHIATKFSSNKDFNLSFLLENNSLDEVIEILTSKTIEIDKLERLRNHVRWENSIELAQIFDKTLQSKGYKFKQSVFTKEEEEKQHIVTQSQNQSNFDILFNIQKLLGEIKSFFEKNNNKISREKYDEIEERYFHKKNNIHLNERIILDLIHHILIYETNNTKKTINYDFFKKTFIEDDFILIKHIKNSIDGNKKTLGFKINQDQINFIQTWCDKECEIIDFNNIWKITNKRINFFTYNYSKIKAILFFKQNLDVIVSTDFILKSLPYYISENSGEDEFNIMKTWVDNEELFNKSISEKLKRNELPDLSEYHYINYAIELSMPNVINEIKTYFLNDTHINSDKFRLFVKNYKLENTLKEYCIDENMGCYWISLKILLEDNSNNKYCSNKALSYLKSDETKFKNFALQILMKVNHPYILEYIKFLLKNNNTHLMDKSDFLESENYSFYKNGEIIPELFNLIYQKEWKNFRDVYYIKNFYNSYIQNLSKQKKYFVIVQNELNNILDSKLSKDEIFHINILLDSCSDSYINTLSKPMNLEEAIKFSKTVI